MLERKIICNMLSSTSSPTPSLTRAASLPRHMPSVPPIIIPASRTTALSCYDSASPGSIVSSMGTPSPASYPAPFYTTPATHAASEIKTEEVQCNYPYNQSYNSSWANSNHYNYPADPIAYYNTTSCDGAANIVRTMRSEVGPELETSIGCRASDQACYANNNVAFGMTDRYSSQHTNI